MRIVLKSAEKDFVLSHAFRILPLMLWIMWLSSFDPKARILLRSSGICLLPWNPNFKSWDSYDIHGTENYFQIQTKQCLFASISKSVYYAFDCWERDPEERLSYNERWIKQQLKEKGSVQRVLVWLTRLGSPGLMPLLSWVLLLRVGEILKVKLLEV